MMLLFQCILCNSFLESKQLPRAADLTSMQWYLLGWNWRGSGKEKAIFMRWHQQNKLKSHQRPGNKVFTISIHKSTCLELGGIS